MNNNEWFEKAKKSIESLPYENVFKLSELLNASGWEKLSKGERINFGKYFKNEVLNNNIPEIILISNNGTAKYRKIKNS